MRVTSIIMPVIRYNIYIDGHYWCGSVNIEIIKKEYKNMLVSGIEKEAITIMKETRETMEV